MCALAAVAEVVKERREGVVARLPMWRDREWGVATSGEAAA